MDEKPLTLTLSPVGGEGNAAWGHAAYNGAGDGGQGRGKVGGGGVQINAQPATGGQASKGKGGNDERQAATTERGPPNDRRS
jgi:hypothetical protein